MIRLTQGWVCMKKVAPMADKIKGYKPNQVKYALIQSIFSGTGIFLTDDTGHGFMALSVRDALGTPALNIDFIYVDPHHKEIAVAFREEAQWLARVIKAEKIYATVRKNLRAFRKVHGFELEGFILSRRV